MKHGRASELQVSIQTDTVGHGTMLVPASLYFLDMTNAPASGAAAE